MRMYGYPNMTKTMTQGSMRFKLHVEEVFLHVFFWFLLIFVQGSFTDSEILVMLGENGTGKTTFIRMMAGLLKSDEQVRLACFYLVWVLIRL